MKCTSLLNSTYHIHQLLCTCNWVYVSFKSRWLSVQSNMCLSCGTLLVVNRMQTIWISFSRVTRENNDQTFVNPVHWVSCHEALRSHNKICKMRVTIACMPRRYSIYYMGDYHWHSFWKAQQQSLSYRRKVWLYRILCSGCTHSGDIFFLLYGLNYFLCFNQQVLTHTHTHTHTPIPTKSRQQQKKRD